MLKNFMFSTLLLFTMTALVSARGVLYFEDSIAKFSTPEDYREGVIVKAVHVGCSTPVEVKKVKFSSKNSYFQVEGVELPCTFGKGSTAEFLIRLKDEPATRAGKTGADTLIIDMGYFPLKIAIDYDEEMARDLSTPVITDVNKMTQVAGFNHATQQISFNESGVVNAKIYSINGTLLATVAQGENLTAGSNLSLKSATESLASGIYVLEGSISQKPFSFKFEK